VADVSMTGAVASAGIDATGATPTSRAATTMGEAVTRVPAARTGASMGAISTPMPMFFISCALFVQLVLFSCTIILTSVRLFLCFIQQCGCLRTMNKY